MNTEHILKPALVLNVKPKWYDDYDNRPGFEVLLSHVPHEEYIYITDGKGHYRGQIDDSVIYIYNDDLPSTRRGFGGRESILNMADGKVVKFNGGWSSNAATINASFPSNDPIVEASVTDKLEVFERGYTFYSGAVTIASILEFWLNNEAKLDWGLALCFDRYSCWFEPTKGAFIKWGNVGVACRFRPYKERGKGSGKDLLKLFWHHWGSRMAHVKAAGGELSGDQMAAVRA